MNKRITIFLDIDGTITKHHPPSETSKPNFKISPLKGTIRKLLEWEKMDYYIILTTARKESQRDVTKKQLSQIGVFYDQLIMGIGSGRRYLINDSKPDGQITAFSINLKRNDGIGAIKI